MMRGIESSPASVDLIASIKREIFFFSSRRRHTIFDCDWSSDVCSSDLVARPHPALAGPDLHRRRHRHRLGDLRSEEHTSELQSQSNLVCRLLLEKKKKKDRQTISLTQ